jgi:hypothetical protein
MNWRLTLAIMSIASVASGCNEGSPTKPTASSSGSAYPADAVTPPGLDSAKLAKLRKKYGGGGCSAATTDASGTMRGVALGRTELPFAIPAIQHDVTAGHGNGKIVQMTVHRAGKTDVTMNCWVPSTVTPDDMAKSFRSSSDDAVWSSLFGRVATARVIPSLGQRVVLSPEAIAFAGETLAPLAAANAARGASTDDGCVPVRGIYEGWDLGTGGWIEIEIDITTCDGGDDLFLYVADGPYGNDPYVVVKADKYQPIGVDSVLFTAELVNSEVHMSPIGWSWIRSTVGGGDPWTQECLGTAFTCKAEVHGQGQMRFTFDTGSGTIWAYAQINPVLAADVDSLGLPDNGDTNDAVLSTAHFATNPISDAQALQILATAIAQPDWVYTQGCALCDSVRTYSEPAKNLANHYGDCTDFVWAVANQYLGSTAWPFSAANIARTSTFASATTSNIGYYGYVITDSAHARKGDVIVSGGHAGIFYGFQHNLSGTYGIAMGWANNGHPATNRQPNQDLPVGKASFKNNGAYWRFFRQATP